MRCVSFSLPLLSFVQVDPPPSLRADRPPLEEDPVSRAFCTSFYNYISPPNATTLTIKPSKTRIMPGGLERVVKDGFRLLGVNLIGERKEEEKKSGEEWMRPISAEKLVYLID